MQCVICQGHLYDEYVLIADNEEFPICLECDDSGTILNWEQERN